MAASPGRGRRERRKREVRDRICEATRELIDQQGFRGTTVAEIATRADVAEKTFFNHFPTKQHVVRALAYDAIDDLVERLEQVRKLPGSTRDRVFSFFEQIAENAEQGGPMQRDLLTETIHALHDARDESRQVLRLHDAFESMVLDGLAEDEPGAGHDSKTLTNVILGAFYSLMFNWAHVEGYPIRSQARATASFLSDALEAARAKPA